MQGKHLFKRKWIIGLCIVLGMAILGAALFQGRGSTADNGEAPKLLIRPVKTMSLSKSQQTETRSFPGVVQVAAETELAFRVDGPLIEFDVRIGQRVEKGDVIARIDSRDFEIRVMRLRANLAAAQANLKAMRAGARAEDIAALEARLIAARSQMNESERNFDRHKSLMSHNAVSQAQYDQTKAAFDTAKTNVDSLAQELKKARAGARIEDIEAAEAGIKSMAADLKAAKNAMDDTRLTAPFSGYINRKYVENFENVKNGDPIISLLDFSTVEVRTVISEDLVIRRGEFAAIFCTLDAYPGRRFQSILKEVGHKTSSANQSYPMSVILQIPEKIVVEPGMAAIVSIALRSREELATGFILPTVAVFADSQGHSCVWRIDPQTMRVNKIRVTTGDMMGDSIRVLSGLNPGDRVVTAGARFLRDNQQVRILTKDPETNS